MDNFIYWGAAIVVRIIMPSIILNLYFNVLLIPKESKHLQKYSTCAVRFYNYTTKLGAQIQ